MIHIKNKEIEMRVTIFIDDDLLSRSKEAAKQDRRSFSSWACIAIEEKLSIEHQAKPELIENIKKSASVPYQKIVDLYHEMLPDCPSVRLLTDARKSSIRQRWLKELEDLDSWRNYFEHVSKSKFLTGKVESIGRKPFVADLEWLCKPNNLAKIAEGKYHG